MYGIDLEEVGIYVYLDQEVNMPHYILLEIAHRRVAWWCKFHSIIGIPKGSSRRPCLPFQYYRVGSNEIMERDVAVVNMLGGGESDQRMLRVTLPDRIIKSDFPSNEWREGFRRGHKKKYNFLGSTRCLPY